MRPRARVFRLRSSLAPSRFRASRPIHAPHPLTPEWGKVKNLRVVSVCEKVKLTGTKDDFVKVVQDWRKCETIVFVRALAKDDRIIEIELGTQGPLKVVEKGDPEYEELSAYVTPGKDSGWDFGLWQKTSDSMLELWRKYLEQRGEIT